MSVSGGPDIVDNGLVMYLDTTNPRSFRGEPTTNLIANPDFANNTTSWSANQNVTLSVETVNSIRVLKVRSNQSSSTPGFLSNNITVTGNTVYTLTIRAYKNDTANIYLYATGNGTGGTNIVWTSTNGPNPITTQLTTISRTFTTPADMTTLQVGALWSPPTITSEAYVQYMQLEAKAYATAFVSGTRGTTVATGGGWGDITGNNNNGELVNGPTYSSSRGGSIVFDGINDSVQLQSSTAINNLTQNFSVEAVVLFTTSSGQYGIITKGNNFTQGWSLYLREGPQFSFIGYNTASVSSGIFPTPAGEVISNTWYHVTYTYDNARIRGYINGQEKVSLAYTQTFSSVGTVPIIGHDPNVAAPRYWSGNIASVKLYNRTLTPLEILQNFNATRSRFGI